MPALLPKHLRRVLTLKAAQLRCVELALAIVIDLVESRVPTKSSGGGVPTMRTKR